MRPKQPRGDLLSREFTLDQLPLQALGVVVRIEGDTPTLRRMVEMGLLPGTEVRALRRAPLGDPIEIWLRGYALTLRAEEARSIYVRETPVLRKLRL